jgi:hypothetical protein
MTDTPFLPHATLLGISLVLGCGAAQSSPPASAAASSSECQAGEQKQESCNTCSCSDDGRWICTMKFCATCEVGHDQTCNDDPTVSSLWGHCNEGQCTCNPGFEQNPDTGRCRPESTVASEPQ